MNLKLILYIFRLCIPKSLSKWRHFLSSKWVLDPNSNSLVILSPRKNDVLCILLTFLDSVFWNTCYLHSQSQIFKTYLRLQKDPFSKLDASPTFGFQLAAGSVRLSITNSFLVPLVFSSDGELSKILNQSVKDETHTNHVRGSRYRCLYWGLKL